MAYTPRFSTRERDGLWSRETTIAQNTGRGALPICTICDGPIGTDQAWDKTPARRRRRAGIGHCKCIHAEQPVVAPVSPGRAEKARKFHRGIAGPGLGNHPMEAGRRSTVSKRMDGHVVPRLTQADRHALFMRGRAAEFVTVDDFSEPLEVHP
jgi:hypothetical protein